MRPSLRAAILATTTLAVAAPAMAQARATARRPNNVFVSISGGVQQAASDISDHFSFSKNQETEAIDVKYPMKPWTLFDVGGSFRVWKGLAFGAAFSRTSGNGDADVTASVPHPFFFNQPRSVTGEFDGDRKETAVHVQVKWLVPVSNKMLVTIFGGPSFFKVEQDIVNDFEYSESYPFDTATFTRAVAANQSESAIGVNVGGDVAYYFSPNVGVGGMAQYSGATVEMTLPSGTGDVKAGGFQVGGGIRLRF